VRIHAIQTGTVAVKERQRHGRGRGPTRLVITMLDRDWTEPLPIHAWLIEHDEGLILVDTGETARTTERGYFPRWHPYFRLGVREWVRPEQEIGPQLERLGFSPRDVRRVVVTHLHTDHAGGLHHLPASEILVNRTELDLASGAMGRLRGYLPHRWPHWFRPTPVDFDDEPFGAFASSRRLTEAGDVTLLPTPGHTAGHMSVAVRTDDRLVLLAGDASYTQSLMLDGLADGVTNDEATARDTLRRIRRLTEAEPTVYLPSHDPDSARRLRTLELARPEPAPVLHG
jgi:glyoxylase-like metal-dependent hydrolase (beta-lactamase superfamily II)